MQSVEAQAVNNDVQIKSSIEAPDEAQASDEATSDLYEIL
jgi:hypothetical protein